MKKVIAAAAGLMIAGSAMVASAAVEFSGDARARYNYMNLDTSASNGVDSMSQDTTQDFFSHRIRLNVDATNAGGSFAKVRLRMDDNMWGSGTISDNDGGAVTTEYAYIGVPMGCTLFTAGRQPLSLTKGYFNDAGVDNVRLAWDNNDGTTLAALYGVVFDLDNGDEAFGASPWGSDSEKNDLVTVVWGQEWNEDWTSTVAISYVNLDYSNADFGFMADQLGVAPIDADDAFMGVIAVAGQAGPVALTAELGYQEKGIAATDTDAFLGAANSDDAFGIYATAGMDFDALDMTLVGAYGQEGYVWDAPVGFMLLGGDTQLSILSNVGSYGLVGAHAEVTGPNGEEMALSLPGIGAETFLVGLQTTYQATEELGLLLNLGYIDASSDEEWAGKPDLKAYEVSGQVAYAVNDGTVLYGRLGYANLDVDVMGASVEQDVFAGGLSLELKF